MRKFSKNILFNDREFASLCEQFSEKFPKDIIETAHQNFSWGGAKSFTEALEQRQSVANIFSTWVGGGCCEQGAIEAIEIVHKWGFGGQGLNRNQVILFEPKHLTNFIEMIKAWHAANDPVKMRETLSICLRTPYVKIARFSKWICFIDQSKYAIYDSRVYLAMRQIQLEGKRVFPTLGAKSKGRPTADFISTDSIKVAEHVSQIYMVYLDLLHNLLPQTSLNSVADIEMGLFMLGVDEKYW